MVSTNPLVAGDTKDSAVVSSISQSKDILMVVSDGFGGYGDFLFVLKMVEQIKKYHSDRDMNPPSIFIVTQPSGREKIIQLLGTRAHDLEIITPDQLARWVGAERIDVGLVLEGPVFQTDLMDKVNEALKDSDILIPLVLVPEYGTNTFSDEQYIQSEITYRKEHYENLMYQKRISTGFLMDGHGILLSELLIHPPAPNVTLEQLDEHIRHILFSRSLSSLESKWEHYQGDTELSLQYSHDEAYPSPADHFLKIHLASYRHRSLPKNQDIIMVGGSALYKCSALKNMRDELIANHFTYISFFNADDGTEECIYDADRSARVYRVIFTKKMSHASMMACHILSGKFTGVTGDQSFGEAVSAGKVFVYQCLEHKKTLIQHYDDMLIEASGNDADIILLLEFLRRKDLSHAEYDWIGMMLTRSDIQNKLHEANRVVMQRGDLIETVVNTYQESQKSLKEELFNKVMISLRNGNFDDAAKILRRQKEFIQFHEFFAGKPLWKHICELRKVYPNEVSIVSVLALINPSLHIPYEDLKQELLEIFISLLEQGQVQAAEDLFTKKRDFFNFDDVVHGKALWKHVCDARMWNAVLLIPGNINNRKVFYNEVQKDNFLADLRAACPPNTHPLTGKLSYLLVLNKLEQYHPKPGTEREKLHQSFQELYKMVVDLSSYDEDALIGLLILNAKKIASEYRLFSPTKGKFFGSRMYSICDDALKDLGVSLKAITKEEEQRYYRSLKSLLHRKPDFLRNESIIKSLSQQAALEIPKIPPLISLDMAQRILMGIYTGDAYRLIPVAHGFYMPHPTPIGRGGWGVVYAAHYYFLDKSRVNVSSALALKKMGAKTVISEEADILRQLYPDGHVAEFENDSGYYLAMPLLPGVTLDKYLTSHETLSREERLSIVISLLEDVDDIHKKGVTHNDLKLKNILFDPVERKIHTVDFGCAKNFHKREQMRYTDIDSAVFAFEIPPEYLHGTPADPSLDVYALTSIVAETLGVNKRVLVQERLSKALSGISDPALHEAIQMAFSESDTIEEALFSSYLCTQRRNPNFEQFIIHYIETPYDFSSYRAQLGEDIYNMLIHMQERDASKRPTLKQCIDVLGHDLQHTDSDSDVIELDSDGFEERKFS